MRLTPSRLLEAVRRWGRASLLRRGRVADAFHRIYFDDVFDRKLRVSWLGVEVLKYPTDLIVYQEIIHELRPDLLVETGTNAGGSAPSSSPRCSIWSARAR